MPHTPQPMNPRASHSGLRAGALGWPSSAALMAGSVFLAALGFSVTSKPNQANSVASSAQPPQHGESELEPQHCPAMFGLGIGLAGPPLLAADGGWWLLGRDGEIGHFRADDHLLWSISIGSTITGAAASDEQGILYVPTARDLVYAVEPSGQQRWRFRAPAGIVGPVGWVAGQGLVFVGRDRALYWLDQHANLVLRAPLGSRVSAGPVSLGSRAVIGTETGQLVAATRQGKRQTVRIGAPITAILPTKTGILVLASGTAFELDAELRILWSRENVLGIGVTSALGHEQRPCTSALLQASGKVDWLDALGNTVASVALDNSVPPELLPEFAVTDHCAWISFDSGVLWQACIDKPVKSIALAPQVSLTRPILDLGRARVMVGSSEGSFWSLPVVSDP